MPTFKTTIHKFDKQGEKTGWTYILIPAHIAHEIKPDTRTSFRVKGKLDQHLIKQVALLPMGEGDFIIPINAGIRKGIRKGEGAMIDVDIELDESEFVLSPDLMDCLEDEPKAMEKFHALPPSHQKYYSKWIEEAKTVETRTKRITQAVAGLAMQLDYGSMIRHFKNKK
ncbi:YdeI/OmpD-associated family protein [Emticicia fluvialis]|uniref:YdeI/OmpD-associated family protein n=1 Tax=Emticicia fluvialis TaxID=2974474 RepID=UPI0021668966|nr:YdeI/OmpD-associated family protein [Emticicia fluvialis]